MKLIDKYGWKAMSATSELLERTEDGKSVWRLVFRINLDTNDYGFGTALSTPPASAFTDLLELWEPETALTIQKPVDPPPPNRWDSQYDEAWRVRTEERRARNERWAQFVREETEADENRQRETWGQQEDDDIDAQDDWELLAHWDIERT